MLEKILAVALGGAIGALTRMFVTEWIQHKVSYSLPYGTMIVNLLGALIIGLLMSWFLNRPDTPIWIKFFLVTGCLGGLTTFSTFSFEWVDLLMTGDYTGALFYGGIQILGGLLLCWLGLNIGRAIW